MPYIVMGAPFFRHLHKCYFNGSLEDILWCCVYDTVSKYLSMAQHVSIHHSNGPSFEGYISQIHEHNWYYGNTISLYSAQLELQLCHISAPASQISGNSTVHSIACVVGRRLIPQLPQHKMPVMWKAFPYRKPIMMTKLVDNTVAIIFSDESKLSLYLIH